MKKIVIRKGFKKAIKKLRHDSESISRMQEVIKKLAEGASLDARYFDHQLTGSLKDFRECHVKPDLLLVYSTDQEYLYLVDLGSHSDLFG